MSGETLCLHNKFGFCKYGELCRREHVNEICENEKCKVDSCNKRHPRKCKYFEEYRRCKFSDYCAFSHEIPRNPIEEELNLIKDSIKALEREIKTKHKDMVSVLERIKNILNSDTRKPEPSNPIVYGSSLSIPSPTPPTFNMLSPSQSTMAVVAMSTSNATNCETREIPQVDGQIETLVCTPQNRCENCDETFENEEALRKHIDELSCFSSKCEFCSQTFNTQELLREHNDSHGFCCEDCLICYKTQLESDLHELKVHPGSHYAEMYIPQSTKTFFAKQRN